ncbi:hypothetical protein GCM10009733_075640 [Nonomuraea maheshkhaliensis]|uniref:PLAT domain-containing protein n=1 Tax=Nonomuraea maheshkhaliensis TaxID=419590 RepID=A0ABP4S707_9ACTN
MKSDTFTASSAPLQLAAGESSEFLDIETSNAGQTALIRVTTFPADGRQNGGRPPLIRLKADAGPTVEVKEFPEEQEVIGAENRTAGSATWMRKNTDVYLVRVTLDRPESSWRVQIVNDGPDDRMFHFMSFGDARIRGEGDWPDFDFRYCGSFPCACTVHDGNRTTACTSCGHSSEVA